MYQIYLLMILVIISFFGNCKEKKDKKEKEFLLLGAVAAANSGGGGQQTGGSGGGGQGTPETVATPTFSPGAGNQTSLSNITISTTTSGATIYYTTDGTNPTTSSSQYSSPLVNIWSLAGKTIKAFAKEWHDRQWNLIVSLVIPHLRQVKQIIIPLQVRMETCKKE